MVARTPDCRPRDGSWAGRRSETADGRAYRRASGRRRHGLVCWAALVTGQAACANGVAGPEADRAGTGGAAGLYALVNAGDVAADAGRSFLRLVPRTADAGPAYQWTVVGLFGSAAGSGDHGDWSLEGGRVEFR